MLGELLLVVLGTLLHAGLSRHAATGVLVLGLGGYGLWLHWFLARHGLGAVARSRGAAGAGGQFRHGAAGAGPRLLALCEALQ